MPKLTSNYTVRETVHLVYYIIRRITMELIRVQDSDYRKTYDLYMTFPANENGYINNVYGYDYDQFLEWIEKKRNWSEGKDLPDGFVADTTYVSRR